MVSMIENLIKAVSEEDRSRKVVRAALGLGYTAVEVDGKGIGLSANISASGHSSCTVFKKAGSLKGARAGEVLELGFEADLVSRSIGLAALNAINNTGTQGYEGNIFDKIQIREGDRVAMVGFIAPVARMLQDRGCQVDVFELRDVEARCIRPAEEMQQTLTQAEIVILTATTLINGSLGGIISQPFAAREVILMGPSTPVAPAQFSKTAITFLAGCRVVDEEKTFRIVIEGGGTEVLYSQGAMKKIIQEVR